MYLTHVTSYLNNKMRCMIPVDGTGWNAGDWFDAPSDVPCVFVVSV